MFVFSVTQYSFKVLQFAKGDAIGPSRGVNPRGCCVRHYFAEVGIHSRVSNNSFPGTEKNVR